MLHAPVAEQQISIPTEFLFEYRPDTSTWDLVYLETQHEETGRQLTIALPVCDYRGRDVEDERKWARHCLVMPDGADFGFVYPFYTDRAWMVCLSLLIAQAVIDV